MKDGRWAQRVELVASISVVVTLVLLVVEVRGNTKALERQVLLDRASSVAVPFMEGPDLLAAFEKVKEVDGWDALHAAFMDRYEMEPAQSVAWAFFLYKIWNGLVADYVYGGPTDDLAASIRGLLRYPDNELYWRHISHELDGEFVAYVESIASTPAAQDEEAEE